MGVLLAGTGNLERGVHHLEHAVASKPDFAQAHDNLGGVLASSGHWSEAEDHYRRALRLAPEDVSVRYRLGTVLESQGKLGDAIEHYREVLRRDQTFLRAANDIAWIMATADDSRLRDGNEAVQWAEKCAQATGNGVPEVLDTLAATYAEVGRFPEAVSTAVKAIDLAQANRQDRLAGQVETRLQMYKKGRPHRTKAVAATRGPIE